MIAGLDTTTTMDRRTKIIHDFTRWAAASAARQGAELRGRKLYPYIDGIDRDALLHMRPPDLTDATFERWYRAQVETLANASGLSVGWAAKIVNMTTKIEVYISGGGDPLLKSWIHPPIDKGLVDGISRAYPLKGGLRVDWG